MNKNLLSIVLAIAFLSAESAIAGPVIVNVALSDIITAFDDLITGTGTSVITTQVVLGTTTYNYIDKDGNAATVTVTRSNGSTPSFSGVYSDNGISLSGYTWNISPSSSNFNTIPGDAYGLTFDFSSPVNAFGFEVGDWATCCMSNTRPNTIQTTYKCTSHRFWPVDRLRWRCRQPACQRADC